ncbi:MAG: Lrp/AsnC family transcriptional regulator, partial [Thermoprotei archaeon]
MEGPLLNKIDEKDLKILSILRKNVRTPYTVIARELNVSEAAVRKRVEKLIRMGV